MTMQISRRQSHNGVNVRFRKRSVNEGVSPANPGIQKAHRRGIVAGGNDPSREIADELPLLAGIEVLDCVHELRSPQLGNGDRCEREHEQVIPPRSEPDDVASAKSQDAWNDSKPSRLRKSLRLLEGVVVRTQPDLPPVDTGCCRLTC